MIAKLPRYLLLLAALLAIAASILILTSSSEMRTTIFSDAGGYEEISRVFWWKSQGAWGVIVVLIFTALFYAPYHFYRRDRLRMVYLFALADIALTYLSGFSIGATFIPAALALLLAIILLALQPRKTSNA